MTTAAVYAFPSLTMQWKLSEHSPAVRQTLELVSQLSDTDPDWSTPKGEALLCSIVCVGVKQTTS